MFEFQLPKEESDSQWMTIDSKHDFHASTVRTKLMNLRRH